MKIRADWSTSQDDPRIHPNYEGNQAFAAAAPKLLNKFVVVQYPYHIEIESSTESLSSFMVFKPY